ncbi:hypothetical protein [Mucilaginibacter segetis]|uniref:Uncharacterized protein n=1 Tax=Mucilaginibacter segetis TaxID=2793071 RepID=A0A934UMK3_9SPHI|nr:hypothetical protein [Mucilaginibacter segetis]MBK0379748.1 hypothetical protein [Mucilaginibacter segetis]
MIKWFLYIVLLMIFVPRLLAAKSSSFTGNTRDDLSFYIPGATQRDTIITKTDKQHSAEDEKQDKKDDKDKKKIKEVAKAKKMPKPEKVEDAGTADSKEKPKRKRRPEGVERPPEIPRRNNN